MYSPTQSRDYATHIYQFMSEFELYKNIKKMHNLK